MNKSIIFSIILLLLIVSVLASNSHSNKKKSVKKQSKQHVLSPLKSNSKKAKKSKSSNNNHHNEGVCPSSSQINDGKVNYDGGHYFVRKPSGHSKKLLVMLHGGTGNYGDIDSEINRLQYETSSHKKMIPEDFWVVAWSLRGTNRGTAYTNPNKKSTRWTTDAKDYVKIIKDISACILANQDTVDVSVYGFSNGFWRSILGGIEWQRTEKDNNKIKFENLIGISGVVNANEWGDYMKAAVGLNADKFKVHPDLQGKKAQNEISKLETAYSSKASEYDKYRNHFDAILSHPYNMKMIADMLKLDEGVENSVPGEQYKAYEDMANNNVKLPFKNTLLLKAGNPPDWNVPAELNLVDNIDADTVKTVSIDGCFRYYPHSLFKEDGACKTKAIKNVYDILK